MHSQITLVGRGEGGGVTLRSSSTINMALVERRLQGLRNDPRISPLIVKGKSTGKHLGTGSFGSVEEVLHLMPGHDSS